MGKLQQQKQQQKQKNEPNKYSSPQKGSHTNKPSHPDDGDMLNKVKKQHQHHIQKQQKKHQRWLTPGKGIAIIFAIAAVLLGIVLSFPPAPPTPMFQPPNPDMMDEETLKIRDLLIEREKLIQDQQEGRRLDEHVERDVNKFIDDARRLIQKEALLQSSGSQQSDVVSGDDASMEPRSPTDPNESSSSSNNAPNAGNMAHVNRSPKNTGELDQRLRFDMMQQEQRAQEQQRREEMLLSICQSLIDRTTELVLSNSVTDALHVVNEMADIIEKAQPCPVSAKFEIYEDMADFCTHMRYYNLAAPVRKLILNLPIGKKETMLQQTAMATDLYYDHKYDDSLELITDTLEEFGDEFPIEAKRMLLMLQAQAYECKGDLITSLHFVEVAANVQSSTPPLQLMLFHYDLLLRVKESEDIPESVAASMGHRLHNIGSILLRIGTWKTLNQLPKHYIPGLLALPWHDFRSYATLAKFEALLEMHHNSLASELEDLIRKKLLSSERECIHEISGGNWFRYEINGYWHPLDHETKCSLETPVACGVIESMKAAGLRVVRAGFSALDAHTVLKPHFGVTNAQLKFHLGLHVPTNEDGSPCAFLKVGHESRPWKVGKVLFFDDSFRHSVVNRCETIRSVFQVVFVHPDLQDESTIEKYFSQAKMEASSGWH